MTGRTQLVELVREAITRQLGVAMGRDPDFDGLDSNEHYALANAAIDAVVAFITEPSK